MHAMAKYTPKVSTEAIPAARRPGNARGDFKKPFF
jgi:hypothetical protein